MKPEDIIEVKIEKMANRGKGLARYNEQVVFIPLTAPGDLVKAKITKVSRSFMDAELVEIIQPSPIRISPKCEYFGTCGGCQFQHLDYPTQLKIKAELVYETLRKALGTETLLNWEPPMTSPKEWRYRNRIQLHKQSGKMGFMRRSSHEVVDINDCLITEESITDSLAKFKTDIELTPKFEAYLDSNLTVKTRSMDDSGHSKMFSQINRFANEVLVSKVLDWLHPKDNSSLLLDLYCGDGNFLVPLTRRWPKNPSIGVEFNSMSVSLLKKLQIPNMLIYNDKVENWLEFYKVSSTSSIILDPPRIGADPRVLAALGSMPSHQIIYVSCEPTTLARDLKTLQQIAARWHLELRIHRAVTIDLFPQTEHIETIVEFSIASVDTPLSN